MLTREGATLLLQQCRVCSSKCREVGPKPSRCEHTLVWWLVYTCGTSPYSYETLITPGKPDRRSTQYRYSARMRSGRGDRPQAFASAVVLLATRHRL